MAAFRLTTKAKPAKACEPKEPAPPPPVSVADRTSISDGTNGCPQRSELIWQSMTPEMRVEALRASHLVNLFKQVNPELRLCRRSSSDAGMQVKRTLDKGIQVPDIRLELAGVRRPPRNQSFRGRGANLQSEFSFVENRNRNLGGVRQPPPFPGGQFFLGNQRFPWSNLQQHSVLRTDSTRSNFRRNAATLRSFDIQSAIPRMSATDVFSNQIVDQTVIKNVAQLNPSNDNETSEAKDPGGGEKEPDATDSKDCSTKSKAGNTSSGDDDSVVVVLNEPKKERDLERKYGQFFCRRCLRAWSSRNLWCVQGSSKVYIKQTCNTCNKVVNPYIVCHLTPMLDYRQNRGSNQDRSSETDVQ